LFFSTKENRQSEDAERFGFCPVVAGLQLIGRVSIKIPSPARLDTFRRRASIDIAKRIRKGKGIPFMRSLVWNVNELDGARAKHPPNANDSCGRDKGSGDAIRFDRNE
jgi:hypothetical protein